jgi:hypothetical protein
MQAIANEKKVGAHSGDNTDQVFDLLLQGHGIMHIRQYCAETYPDDDAGQLISGAFDIFSHLSNEPASVIRGFVLTNSKDLFRRNMEIGDFKAAQDCLKMLLKISEGQPVGEDDEN